MRKFIFLMVTALVMFVSGASAQNSNLETAVQKSEFFDNVYVGVQGGGTWSLMNHDKAFFENVNVDGLFRVGKYVTPITAIQLSAEVGGLEGGKCFVDHTNIMAGLVTNWTNLVLGYNGTPRVFEIESEVAAGWFHGYGNHIYNSTSTRAAVYFNWNLGKSKAWQLNLVPAWTYLPAKSIEHSYASLNVGVTYKFKNKGNKKHHFTLVNVISPEEWESMNRTINDLQAEKLQLENALAEKKEVIVRDTVMVIEKSPVEISNVVAFKINSSKVEPTQMANLSHVVDVLKQNEGMKLLIKGYADKETGTAEYNKELSLKRVEAVKELLVKEFGIESERIEVMGLGDSEQVYKTNDWNRVVMFVTPE